MAGGYGWMVETQAKRMSRTLTDQAEPHAFHDFELCSHGTGDIGNLESRDEGLGA